MADPKCLELLRLVQTSAGVELASQTFSIGPIHFLSFSFSYFYEYIILPSIHILNMDEISFSSHDFFHMIKKGNKVVRERL